MNLVNRVIAHPLKILVVGDVILDCFVSGDVRRLSPEAGVPVLSNITPEWTLGGAANVCVSLKQMGLHVVLMGLIGNDFSGGIVRDLLNQHGIETEALYSSEKIKTSTKIRFLGNHQQQYLRVDHEAFYALPANIIAMAIAFLKDHIHDYDVIVLSDYSKGFLADDFAQRIIRLAVSENKKVLVDPKGSSFTKYRGSFLIKPNISELGNVLGATVSVDYIMQNADRILDQLSQDQLLVTCGEQGMILLRKDQKPMHHIEPTDNVVDVTGAGDVVTACFAVGIAYDIDFRKLLEISCKCAKISIQRRKTSAISLEELFLAERKESKILCTNRELHALRIALKKKKIVFTNGCFDIFHAGHIQLLQDAKRYGDVLVVGVNSDESIRKIKGEKRPICTLYERIGLLESISCIDWIVPFTSKTPEEIIRCLKPDILVKGADYSGERIVGSDFVKEHGGKIVLIPHRTEISSTRIIERITNCER